MLSLLSGLVEQVAEELLLRLPGSAPGRVDVEALTDRLRRSGLLTGQALIGLLVRRADLIAFRASARQQDDAGPLKAWAKPDCRLDSRRRRRCR